MIVVDTNVLVRYAVKDDPQQALTATRLLADNLCLLIPTVALELAWVLGSKAGYGLDRADVAARIRHIAGLPNIRVEQPEALAFALNWYEGGMDIADALHLALTGPNHEFATFDKRIQTRARQIGLPHRITLL